MTREVTHKTFSRYNERYDQEIFDEETVKTVNSIQLRSEALKINLQDSSKDIELTSKFSQSGSR